MGVLLGSRKAGSKSPGSIDHSQSVLGCDILPGIQNKLVCRNKRCFGVGNGEAPIHPRDVQNRQGPSCQLVRPRQWCARGCGCVLQARCWPRGVLLGHGDPLRLVHEKTDPMLYLLYSSWQGESRQAFPVPFGRLLSKWLLSPPRLPLVTLRHWERGKVKEQLA